MRTLGGQPPLIAAKEWKGPCTAETLIEAKEWWLKTVITYSSRIVHIKDHKSTAALAFRLAFTIRVAPWYKDNCSRLATE